jgi:hypothetical protein
MPHDRLYLRKMRAKHIRRKKNILNNYSWFREYPWYAHDGMYSKGKIHCSCPRCASKTNNKHRQRGNYALAKNWKHSDLQKLQAMQADIADFYNE